MFSDDMNEKWHLEAHLDYRGFLISTCWDGFIKTKPENLVL